ncbi:hypothetical protein, partial [Streptomyces sp. NPDC054765]
SCLRVTPSFLPGSVPMRGRNPKVDHNHTQALAHQPLLQLDQGATTLYVAVAALLRDAGTDLATVLHLRAPSPA